MGDESLLLNLVPELQLKIYSYVLLRPGERSYFSSVAAPLLHTCRLTHNHATSIILSEYYFTTEFFPEEDNENTRAFRYMVTPFQPKFIGRTETSRTRLGSYRLLTHELGHSKIRKYSIKVQFDPYCWGNSDYLRLKWKTMRLLVQMLSQSDSLKFLEIDFPVAHIFERVWPHQRHHFEDHLLGMAEPDVRQKLLQIPVLLLEPLRQLRGIQHVSITCKGIRVVSPGFLEKLIEDMMRPAAEK